MDENKIVELYHKRKRYREDFHAFCYDILGYRDMNPIHKELNTFLSTPKRNKLVLMPRFTFKSCICTIGYALWRLTKDYNLRILIYSDATAKAKGFLGSVKNHIEGKVTGSTFRETFGHWEVDPKKDKWNQEQIVIGFRRNAQAEPSVDTAGQDASKIGFHYDLILFDDIVSDQNVTTKEQMDKTVNCYKKSLSLLKPGGEIIIVGTRWHFGDLYGRLIAENEERPLFETFIKCAYEGDKYFFDDIGENSLTRERLSQLKKQQGSYVFSCLYQNSPVDDETATFKARDFSFAEVQPTDLYITATIDPAGKGEDSTAITVVGTDNEMNMYLLEIVNEKLTPSEMIEKVISLNYKYKFKMFGIETNFFRGMLKLELERRIRTEHSESPTTFPLFGTHEFLAASRRGENKHSRIRGLQPYHERGAIKFPGTRLELLSGPFSELAYQMIQFPNAPFDDICFVAGTKIATIKGDKPIERVKVGDKVITPFGIQKVTASKSTGYRPIVTNRGLTGTPNHKIFTYNNLEKRLDTLTYRDIISMLSRKEALRWRYRKLLFSMESNMPLWGRESIISASQSPIKGERILKDFTLRFGNFITKRQFLKATLFTIRMAILIITTQVTWSVYCVGNILHYLKSLVQNNLNILRGLDLLQKFGTLLKKVKNGIAETLKNSGRIRSQLNIPAFGVASCSTGGLKIINSVQMPVDKQEVERAVDGMKQESVNFAVGNFQSGNISSKSVAQENVQEVFNLTIENDGMYFANKTLVSNCDSLAYHIPLIRAGGLAKKKDLPPNSPAYLEREMYQKEISLRNRLPRRVRNYVAPLSFS